MDVQIAEAEVRDLDALDFFGGQNDVGAPEVLVGARLGSR